MDDRPDGLERKPPKSLLAGGEEWLLRFAWARSIRSGGTVRVPGANPLLVLLVVAGVLAGGVYAYRTFVSDPAGRCEKIEKSFELISIAPPPVLSAIPEALQGSSVEPILLSSMNTAREAWEFAVRTRNLENQPGDPDSVAAMWQSWVAGQRASVLAEENC